ncbi:type II toxin-antitoxin system HipA family toxin [Cryobacterium sp. TMS1-13-1]|uniref:type II toxin-antitoxin system HipA family toxin n=1 Tax=Cryobacterium sp. TMS1-13-1 TaxID=1259220 RepID=UPI00106B2DFF|nr:HipA domain-containing protein [Cryobacterium sp. TMS1-13-1]TFD21748.1 type II toxin-antitoxin system HipA family toxin [Cryobacterium sp. TMS1-13-1]
MSERDLPVYLYGTHTGDLVGTGRGGVNLDWSKAAEDRWLINSPVLSQSLRVGSSTPEQTASFFGALIPEGANLDRLANEIRVPSNDLLGIFNRVGADLAGALRVGDAREATDPQALDDGQIDALLARASGFLVGGGGSALPGFQRKLTLTRDDGVWVRGNGSIPSTHILKPVSDEDRRAVENENYTLAVGRELGLLSFDSWVETIGSKHVLVIERYDRRLQGTTVERIHQEDCAQALGLPWGGNAKFERDDERASLRSIASLLDTKRSAFSPGRPDAERLLRYATFNVAVGNTDAHAKNFSILHHEDGGTVLAPLYDVAPLALGYEASQVMAMSVNDVKRLDEVTAGDLVAEAESWGLDGAQSRALVEETLDSLVEATRKLNCHASIAAHTPGYIRGQAQNLRDGYRARISSSIPLILQKSIGTPRTEG